MNAHTQATGEITAAEARELAERIPAVYWRLRMLAFIEQAEAARKELDDERETAAAELERRAVVYDDEGGGGGLAAYALRSAARWVREGRRPGTGGRLAIPAEDRCSRCAGDGRVDPPESSLLVRSAECPTCRGTGRRERRA